jgi:hypothetical protein
VFGGLNVPQVVAGEQLQVTPAFVGSPLIWATRFAIPPATIVGGGGAPKVTVGGDAVMVTVALALTEVSAFDVRMMVTFPAVDGAV